MSDRDRDRLGIPVVLRVREEGGLVGKTWPVPGIASHDIESDEQSCSGELVNVCKPQPKCESVFGHTGMVTQVVKLT